MAVFNHSAHIKLWDWSGVGVYIVDEYGTATLVRKPKKKIIPIFTRIMLMHGMVRSLSRYCKYEIKEMN